MRKIFWAIQNLNALGGTETVSIKLMNLLCDEYEIHLICTSHIEGKPAYALDPRITVHSLEIPQEVGRFDQCFLAYRKKFQIGKICRLIHRTISAYFYHRNKKRGLIKSWMDEDSIYIGSALDSYLLAPKHAHVFYHFHFDAKTFFTFVNRFAFRFSTKAEKYIFLTKATREKVIEKRPKLKDKSVYVYNPVRFQPKEEFNYHGNKILFVGRFTEQKDPMFALEIAKQLHADKFNFSLTMYGEGHLEPQMREYVSNNKLDEVSIVVGHHVTQEDFSSNDILLCTSIFEGFVLVYGEANSCSLPIVTARWNGAIEEAFVEGQSGWLVEGRNPVDFANKIKEVLSDKDSLIEARKRAYKDSFRLSDGPIKKQWEEILG